MSKLVQLSNDTQNPVARLRCHWESTQIQGKGNASVSWSHFNGRKVILQTDLCVGAPVAIHGINILPEVGLYNGARGTLVDIVYDKGQNPNSKQDYHFPKYVVVDFPHLDLRRGNLQPWDSEHPTVSFICFLFFFFCNRFSHKSAACDDPSWNSSLFKNPRKPVLSCAFLSDSTCMGHNSSQISRTQS